MSLLDNRQALSYRTAMSFHGKSCGVVCSKDNSNPIQAICKTISATQPPNEVRLSQGPVVMVAPQPATKVTGSSKCHGINTARDGIQVTPVKAGPLPKLRALLSRHEASGIRVFVTRCVRFVRTRAVIVFSLSWFVLKRICL